MVVLCQRLQLDPVKAATVVAAVAAETEGAVVTGAVEVAVLEIVPAGADVVDGHGALTAAPAEAGAGAEAAVGSEAPLPVQQPKPRPKRLLPKKTYAK